MPVYIHYGPVETEAELARFRDNLIRFIEGTCPPDEREEAGVMLCAEHLLRFMRHCQEADKVKRELAAGLHETQTVLQEQLLDTTEAQAALQADANRYRWWVKALTTNSDSALDRVDDAFKPLSKETVITVKQFNEAIDAARKQGGA